MSELITNQPRLSEDPELNRPDPKPPTLRYYLKEGDMILRLPDFLDYPETRLLEGAVHPVFPDEFVGTDNLAGSLSDCLLYTSDAADE